MLLINTILLIPKQVYIRKQSNEIGSWQNTITKFGNAHTVLCLICTCVSVYGYVGVTEKTQILVMQILEDIVAYWPPE